MDNTITTQIRQHYEKQAIIYIKAGYYSRENKIQKIMKDYFHPSEFGRCNPPCKKSDMHPETIARLNRMREIAGIPLVLNCAYRSPEHDKAKGRSGTGAHTLGRAVDIRCNSSATRYKIIVAALEAGFTRIGIAGTFVHVDDSPNHAQGVVWTY